MKRSIILSLIISACLLASGSAQAQDSSITCVWRSWPNNECQQGEYKKDSSNCSSADRPASKTINAGGATGGGQTISAGCCCPNPSYTAPKATPPKFVMPELQISIPGLKLTSGDAIKYTDNGDGTYYYQIPWLSEYILGVFNYGLSVAGILAAIVLMAGGVLWLVSSGDASKVTQAKELIIGSITGLVILSSSYIILTQINPALTQFYPIGIGTIKQGDFENALAVTRNNSQADTYKNAPCATDQELASGIEFYATGYYKPAWENTDKFFCVVGMQCSCPNGDDRDTSKNCDFLYGKTYPNYHPCKPFGANIEYCNAMASGGVPQIGDIAGPSNCRANLPLGSKVCFKGKTYTVKDAGGGIKGKRIDIWSGASLKDAYANTGTGILKKGPCN